MKKIMMTMAALLFMAIPADSMSYERARSEALFLTDKMAYELNLTSEQYDAAYEINIDYLMGVSSVDDLYSTYWTRRNLDMGYILMDWQWNAFRAASYFYRPLYWGSGCWHFGIYSRYPHRNYFFFSRPTVYVSYRGGHSWRSNGGRSYYHSNGGHFYNSKSHNGMRDRWDNGEFRGNRGSNSSTRVTVNKSNANSNFGSSRTNGTFRSNRNTNSTTNSSATTFRSGTFGTVRNSSERNSSSSSQRITTSPSQRSGTFGTMRSGSSLPSIRSNSSSSRSNSSSSQRITTSPSQRSGTFGTMRSSSSSSQRSSAPATSSSRSSGSFRNR